MRRVAAKSELLRRGWPRVMHGSVARLDRSFARGWLPTMSTERGSVAGGVRQAVMMTRGMRRRSVERVGRRVGVARQLACALRRRAAGTSVPRCGTRCQGAPCARRRLVSAASPACMPYFVLTLRRGENGGRLPHPLLSSSSGWLFLECCACCSSLPYLWLVVLVRCWCWVGSHR